MRVGIGYEPDRDFEKLRAAKAAYRPMLGAPGLTLVELELTRRHWRAPAFARRLAEDLQRLAQAESAEAARTAHIERRLWQDPVLFVASVPDCLCGHGRAGGLDRASGA